MSLFKDTVVEEGEFSLKSSLHSEKERRLG